MQRERERRFVSFVKDSGVEADLGWEVCIREDSGSGYPHKRL